MKPKPSLEEARNSKEQLDRIKFRLKVGHLEYYAAKAEAEPHLQILNAYLAKRARDYGMRPQKVHFATWMR